MLQKTLRRTTKCKTAKITKAKQNIPNIKLTVNVRVCCQQKKRAKIVF